MEKTIVIPVKEYDLLKRKAKVADDAMLQLELSLNDLESGRVRKVA